MPIARLNCGCGPVAAAGWINSDILVRPGVDVCCDIRRGLALRDATFFYAVAMHVLQDLAWPDIPPALSELHRVLRPGGILRIGVPDLDRAIAAYQSADRGYFYIPDQDSDTLGGKLITQIIWYGSVRTPFTFDFLSELLSRTGFANITRCTFRGTHSHYPEIVSLDNRPRETLYVEATK